jgi:hypothetical protein
MIEVKINAHIFILSVWYFLLLSPRYNSALDWVVRHIISVRFRKKFNSSKEQPCFLEETILNKQISLL